MSGAFQIPAGTVSVIDYKQHARVRMSGSVWAYISGGSADERTIAENVAAFARLRLQGRVLVDMQGAKTALNLFGIPMDYPILLAPVALHGLVHPDGERATVLGASAINTAMVVSMESGTTLEDIAQDAQCPLFFQMYIQHDRDFTCALAQRAEAAGYRGLVLTVDAPVSGVRNAEQRVNFHPPAGIEAANLRGLQRLPRPQISPAQSPVFQGLLRGAPVWDDIAWLRRCTRLPLILKGITAPDDAEHAIEAGASGIIVSNHGGRTLDTMPATIDILPRIVERVAGRVPVLVDGGIRRGTDILKALALGASAVLIGRPYIYGLSVGGAAGVAHVINILRTELEIAMTLTGCPTLEQIDVRVLWR